MALVVESTSFNTASNSANVVVTKPTGVASGDLLLILTQGGATCSGFSSAYSGSGVTALYKIADSGDVSASNYTIAHGSANGSGIAAMMRVSGWTSGNPVYASDFVSASQDLSTPIELASTGLSLLRPSSNSLMIFLNQIGSSSLGTTDCWSLYSVTSGEANPSWTEIVDSTVELASNTTETNIAVAYATTTNSTPITARSTTGTTNSLGGSDFFRSHLLILNAPQDATGTHALLETTPAFFAPAGSADTNGTADMLEVSPTINTQSGTGTSPTQWQSPTKEDTTWTNKNI